MIIKYTGNGKLCWEDSVAMLLSSIGENVSPAYLEAISGCGLSAYFDQRTNWLYFSFALPDQELTYVLKKLGYEIKEVVVPKTRKPPIGNLLTDLKESPAVVGPVDMGLLKYNPNHDYLSGSDHFVLAYDQDDRGLFVHDPAGFPCVYVSFDNFLKCWKSEKVAYGDKDYHYWTKPKVVNKPTPDEIYHQTVKDYQKIYISCDRLALENKWITGSEAILKEASCFDNNSFDDGKVEFLTNFSLPFAIRCTLNIADFLQPYNKQLAKIKYDEANALGLCQTHATQKSWISLAGKLREVATIEQSFKARLFEEN